MYELKRLRVVPRATDTRRKFEADYVIFPRWWRVSAKSRFMNAGQLFRCKGGSRYDVRIRGG